MAAFRSERTFWGTIPDLQPVVSDLVRHFRDKSYTVAADGSSTGLWDVSISKGGTLRAVAGLKFALKVLIVPEPDRIVVTAGVGIFGRQVAPAALGLVGIRAALLAVGAGAAAIIGLPLLVANVWALVKQSKLDDEAMAVVSASIARIAPQVSFELGPASMPALPAPDWTLTAGQSPPCPACESTVDGAARFCGECGTALVR